MNGRTAFDLQHEVDVDLDEIVECLHAAGHLDSAAISDGYLQMKIYDAQTLGDGWLTWNPEYGDSPAIAFAVRDLVRTIASGSYCIPVPPRDQADFKTPPLRVVFADEWGHWPPSMDPAKARDRRYREVPRWLYGRNETECWCRALVALGRAGLIDRREDHATA